MKDLDENLQKLVLVVEALTSIVRSERNSNTQMFEATKLTLDGLINLSHRVLTRLDVAETEIEQLKAQLLELSEAKPIGRNSGEIKSAAREMWEKYKRGENQ